MRPIGPVVLLLAGLGALAGPSFDWGFSEGLAPLEASDWRSAASCGRCHEAEYEAWQGSRHRVAHSNAIYTAGLQAEPKRFCVNCHSPFPQQADEVLGHLDWYAARSPHRAGPTAASPRPATPHADEGISCAACHVRAGAVLATEVSGAAPHQTLAVPELGTSALCGGCHQFRMGHWIEGELRFGATPMQATASEHAAWQAAGGVEACADCHMPDGAHVFRGAHDRDWLRESVAVAVDSGPEGACFQVRSLGVGHQLPSGDLFRRLTLQVELEGGFQVVDTMAHHWEVQVDPTTGMATKVHIADSTLRPGQPRTTAVAAAPGARWRLVYHYGSVSDERRGLVPLEQLLVPLAEGTVPPPGPTSTSCETGG